MPAIKWFKIQVKDTAETMSDNKQLAISMSHIGRHGAHLNLLRTVNDTSMSDNY